LPRAAPPSGFRSGLPECKADATITAESAAALSLMPSCRRYEQTQAIPLACPWINVYLSCFHLLHTQLHTASLASSADNGSRRTRCRRSDLHAVCHSCHFCSHGCDRYGAIGRKTCSCTYIATSPLLRPPRVSPPAMLHFCAFITALASPSLL
jgi:hypothetical protein